MATRKASSSSTVAPKATRERVALPSSVSSDEAVWPGQSRNSSNGSLRAQLVEEVQGMEKGSVRRYAIDGDKEQKAFLNLFRSVVSNVTNDALGVQSVQQPGAVFVKLGDKVYRTRKAK